MLIATTVKKRKKGTPYIRRTKKKRTKTFKVFSTVTPSEQDTVITTGVCPNPMIHFDFIIIFPSTGITDSVIVVVLPKSMKPPVRLIVPEISVAGIVPVFFITTETPKPLLTASITRLGSCAWNM